ncbi:unnamed protein product [Angiostrongylus costaricensis]|uniref:Myb_DNA-bind_3 domain-containing protein n=1 Tax=Angiostrongylus costaricensis TaxID=334426 RepID=A0A0R3PVS0_ANGCS|nr:unnamed protein product [Angiostrongylus costaricensis]
MVFYEGLKQCGKDFDGIMRIMAKRKVDKNKDQTKNYYFNLLKHVKQSISLDEDSMGDIGRDAMELFITINACEWRRRTNTNQYIPDRMKELIFHGSDKSGPIKVKTPPCPSLLKFFYSEFVVEHTNRVNCEQNPLLRIRLNTNDRISRIFQLLRHKWSSVLDRVARFSHLFVFFFHFRRISNLQFFRHYFFLVLITANPSYTVTVSHSFVLNEEIIKSGLCEANVRDAIVAEIYCLV